MAALTTTTEIPTTTENPASTATFPDYIVPLICLLVVTIVFIVSIVRDHLHRPLPTFVLPLVCLLDTVAVFIWSGITVYSRLTWLMEVAPWLIALPILLFTYRKFHLTDLLYVLLTVHSMILMIGGRYTYARVPFLGWVPGSKFRNNYDKVGHFAQGFIPAIVIREWLLRTETMRPPSGFRKHLRLFAVIVLACLGFSAIYEIIEWLTAEILGQGADEFLGSQGDVWDSQKDMAICGVGAMLALFLLSAVHDYFLKKIRRQQAGEGRSLDVEENAKTNVTLNPLIRQQNTAGLEDRPPAARQ